MTATNPSGLVDLPQPGQIPPDEQWRTQVALFCYTLILPLLRHDRQRDGAKCQIREAIAAQQHVIPHSGRCAVSVPTLRRWEKDYLAGGFDALPGLSGQDRQAQAPLRPGRLARPLGRNPRSRRGPQARAARPLRPCRGRHPQTRRGQPHRRGVYRAPHPGPPTGCPRRHHGPPDQGPARLSPLRAQPFRRPVAIRRDARSQTARPRQPDREAAHDPLCLHRRPHPPGAPRPVLLE